MQYLDFERLERIDPRAFQSAEPYPWANPEGALTDAAFDLLRETLPDVAKFEQAFGVERKDGKQSHDRYTLEYSEGLELPGPWAEFVEELMGRRYRRLVARLVGVPAVNMRFHWHYAPPGCSVSPHCDSRKKLGSHIFYFNTEDDWDASWGGETLILDPGRSLPRDATPAFDDFAQSTPAVAIGNRSLLFAGEGSWHGVRPVTCPEGRMRKVFIVVINRVKPLEYLTRPFTGPRFER